MDTTHWLYRVSLVFAASEANTSTLESWANNLTTGNGRKLAVWVTAAAANHNWLGRSSLKLLLIAFVWRRGALRSVSLLISNKQKVTSLKNWTIWLPERLCGGWRGVNYVGCLTGACWLAFEGVRRWLLQHFRAGRGDQPRF